MERATRSAVRCRVPVSDVGMLALGTRCTLARAMREASAARMMAPSILASSDSRCGLYSASSRNPPVQTESTAGSSPTMISAPCLAWRIRSRPSRSAVPGAIRASASFSGWLPPGRRPPGHRTRRARAARPPRTPRSQRFGERAHAVHGACPAGRRPDARRRRRRHQRPGETRRRARLGEPAVAPRAPSAPRRPARARRRRPGRRGTGTPRDDRRHRQRDPEVGRGLGDRDAADGRDEELGRRRDRRPRSGTPARPPAGWPGRRRCPSACGRDDVPTPAAGPRAPAPRRGGVAAPAAPAPPRCRARPPCGRRA